MTRRIVSIVAVLAVAALVATPPLAAGLSAPGSQSVDIDIAFRDTNNNLDFVDAAGNVGSIGVKVDEVGGVGDVNGDGTLEIAFLDTSDNIKFVDASGNTVDTGADAFAVGGVGDINGDGSLEIAFLDTSENIKFVDASGNTVDTGADGDVFARIGGVADIDGDGDLDIAFADSNDNLDYVDAGGNVASTGASAGRLGGIADIDGDGDLDVTFAPSGGGNDDLKYVDASGNIVNTGADADQIGGIADINDDGDLEIAFVSGNDKVKFVDQNGNVVNTGATAFRVGGVADIDRDGVFTADPSLDNSSASPDGTTVTSGSVSLSIPVSDPELDDGDSVTVNVTLNGQQVGSKTITGNQTVSVSAKPQDGSNSWSVTATDRAGNSATSQTFSFTGDFAAPQGSPSPTSGITSYDGDIELAVNDSDFALAAGDTVTVEAANASGGTIGQTTVSSNQTVSFGYSAKAGANDITWTLNDTYGQTTTVSQSFSTPATLSVYNESDPDSLITGTQNEITVSFYGQQDSVFQKTTTDGTVNLSGLPAAPADGYEITVSDGDEYRSRRIVVDSLFEQRSVYLLPASATFYDVRFQLQDFTGGNFEPEDTQLYVAGPITKDFDGDGNTSTRYQTILASSFDVGSGFPTELIADKRYRLRIVNDQGDSRIIGSYTPSEDTVEPITIKGLEFQPPEGQGWETTLNTTSPTSPGGRSLTWKYKDRSGETSRLNVSVTNESGSVVYQDTVQDGVQNYSVYDLQLANDSDYTLAWNATRGGQQIGQTRPVGGTGPLIAIPFDSDWLGTLGMLGVVFVLALADRQKTSYVAMSAVAMAGIMMAIQAVTIFEPLWFLAALLAVGSHLKTMQQPEI